MESLFIYLALGAFAGTLAGLFGIGGGLIIVPVLTLTFASYGFSPEVLVQMAVGTSLGTIVITSLSSVTAHHRLGSVDWLLVTRLLPFVILGGLIGAASAHLLPGSALRTVFGLFELAVAAQMAFFGQPAPHRRLPSLPGLGLVGTVIGSLSAMLGVGGGTLMVPFLAWCNVAMRRAVAVAAATGLPIALAGSIGYLVVGWGVTGLPERATGYLYWPALIAIVSSSVLFAPLGARLAHRLPAAQLRRAFAALLALLGIAMLWG